MMQTAESPVFGLLTQFRGVSVSLDVSCDGKEVLVALDGERFEPTLVHMPHSGRVVVGVVSLGVISLSVSQPEVMTETPHFTVLPWANQKVIVIWHQAVREKFYLESLQSLIEDFSKGFVVRILFKNGGTEVRPVEHVIAMPAASARLGRPIEGIPADGGRRFKPRLKRK